MPNLNHFYNSFSPFQYVGSLAFSFHFLLFVMIFLISNCGFFFSFSIYFLLWYYLYSELIELHFLLLLQLPLLCCSYGEDLQELKKKANKTTTKNKFYFSISILKRTHLFFLFSIVLCLPTECGFE